MKQGVAVTKKNPEVSIRREVSDRFFKMVALAKNLGIIKNEREFAALIGEEQAEFSKMKNPEHKRYIDIEMLYKAANTVGVNANHILVDGGDKTEPLLRDDVKIKGGHVTGDGNVVLTGQAVSQNGDVYFKVEKLIQNLPAKERKAILNKINNLESLNIRANKDIEDLKKTIDRYEREIAKDRKTIEDKEKIIEAQEKIIKMMEKPQKGKK